MTIKYSLQSSLLLDRNEGINITQEDVSSLHSQLIQWKNHGLRKPCVTLREQRKTTRCPLPLDPFCLQRKSLASDIKLCVYINKL